MLECIDLYCGAGGLSLGLTEAGLRVRVAVDSSEECRRTYTANFPETAFVCGDLNDLDEQVLLQHIQNPERMVLAGGPPCQLFSRLNRNSKDQSKGLRPYIRFVRRLSPAYVMFENVPAIMKRAAAWGYLMRSLKRLKYKVSCSVVKAVDFGVPQKRQRTIVIASRNGTALPVMKSPIRTVRDAIAHLPEAYMEAIGHVGMSLGAENLLRIQAIREGENSRDKEASFSDSYARMAWDEPAPTITTKCISFSNGRFGHPVFDRALTLREAACLQGFPESFEFYGSLWERARQIGNAVPPPIARALGEQIIKDFARTKQKKAA